ncbi:MAG: GIY-YIG nuclease family protein [Candidatus Aminicenantes bacterium]|nr:GIY-YIG nuclease family protein [Candidatus Aminicenantes bacterium]
MNLKKFKLKVSGIDKIIPRNKWIEIPVENYYWRFFEFQGLYAFYDKDKIIYIGSSSDISSRLKWHIFHGKFKELGDFSKIKIKITSINQSLLEHIEKGFIIKLRPKYNKQNFSKYVLRKNNIALLLNRVENLEREIYKKRR